VCIGGIVYGLMQITPVSEFLRPVVDPISDLFGSDDIDESVSSTSRSYGTLMHQ
jgi:hypothetical protein